MIEHLIGAFHIVFSFETFLFMFIGALYGVIIGALPGLGTIVALTMCLPFTLTMGPGPAIALLLAVYCGSVYGGSISAVLINVPGTPQSAATNLEGYPMAARGQAAEALGWVTAASIIGGLLSCIVLIVATPQLADLSVKYGGPLEICALIALGLACIGSLSEGNQIKGLLMGVFGLWVATIGTELTTGAVRFTFGISTLEAGVDMLALVVGVFPLAEVFYRIYDEKCAGCAEPFECSKIRFPRLKDWSGRVWTLLKSSVLGIIIGILPGTGPTPATFISYASAKKTSKFRNNFGKGEPDGLIAAESANNAVTGGALVPLLALGIPGDASLALLIGTFIIHDITPGVRLMIDNPDIVYATFAILILSNFMLIPAAVITVRMFNKLMKIPTPLFLGLIVLLSLVGAYISRFLFMDIFIAIIAGVIGFGMRLWNYPAAAFLIGYVLGPQFELRLNQIFIFKGQSSWGEYLLANPVGTVLFIITGIVLFVPLVRSFYQKVRSKENL